MVQEGKYTLRGPQELFSLCQVFTYIYAHSNDIMNGLLLDIINNHPVCVLDDPNL